MRSAGLAAFLVASSMFGGSIRLDQPVSPVHFGALGSSAPAQTGGSIASNGTLSLVAWRESSGLDQAIARAAFIAADGQLSPPIEIGGAHPQSVTATASNGRDFLVAYFDTHYHLVARRVTLEGVLDPTPIVVTPYGTPTDSIAIGWSGQTYVVLTAGFSAVTISGVTTDGIVAVSRQVIDTSDPADTPSIQCGAAGCTAAWHTLTPWPGTSLFFPTENNVLAFTDAAGALQSKVLITDLVGVTPALSAPLPDGRSLFIYSYGKNTFAGRVTAGGVVLDPPALNGGLNILRSGTSFPLQPVATVRDGLYLVELDDNSAGRLYWSPIVAEPRPHVASIVNLQQNVTMPVTLAASSRNTYLLYTSGENDPKLLAPRLFLRTIASPDPQTGTPRRRSTR